MSKCMLTLISFLLFAISSFAGGPWTPDKKGGVLIVNASPVIYNGMSSADAGSLELPRRVIDINTQAYFEFGITNSLAVFGNLNVKNTRTSSKIFETTDFNVPHLPNGRVFGLGNSSAGLKYNFFNKNVLLAVSYATEFPSIGVKAQNGLRTGYDTYSFVPGIHFGQGFEKRIYYYAEAFFAARNKLSHEWRLNIEIGYTFKKPITISFEVSFKESLKDKNVIESPNFFETGLYLNNEEFIAWSATVIYDINDRFSFMSALAGGYRTELIARTPVISAGFLFNWGSEKPVDLPIEGEEGTSLLF